MQQSRRSRQAHEKEEKHVKAYGKEGEGTKRRKTAKVQERT